MNEQIKELLVKAMTEVGPDDTDLKTLEKFAELIVQESMTTILKESKWYWDKDEFESANAV
jgi:hypothetical protein